MFKYKICFHCKTNYGLCLFYLLAEIFVGVWYWKVKPHNPAELVLVTLLLLILLTPIAMIYYHHKEHQREQFNKVIRKFKPK